MDRRKEKADVVTMMVSWAFLCVRRKRRDSVGEKATRAHPKSNEVLVMMFDCSSHVSEQGSSFPYISVCCFVFVTIV